MGKSDQDISKDAAAEYGKRLYRLLQIAFARERGVALADGAIMQITIKAPKQVGGEPLVIVKARVEGQNIIAFSGGFDGAEALRVALERIQNGTIKWREDQPYLPGMEPK